MSAQDAPVHNFSPQNRQKAIKHPISVRKTEEKTRKRQKFRPVKHKKTPFKKKFQQTCRNQKTLIPGLGTEPRPTKLWRHIPRHMILIKSRPGRQKPTKRQVKERCRNRSKRTQRWFLHVYCLKISPGKETANSTRCMPRILPGNPKCKILK